MKRVTKVRVFADLEKEEAYINKMNQKGWKLEYVQFGLFYTFTQSEPDEYFTVLCATDKPKILQMTSAAVLSGYENIPHTYDGVANILYLSGRKDQVDTEFFNDNQNKLNHYKNIKKVYGYQTVLVLLLGTFFALPMIINFRPIIKILCDLNAYCAEHMSSVLTPVLLVSAMGTLGIIYWIVALYLLGLYCKTYNKYKALSSDMKLYE